MGNKINSKNTPSSDTEQKLSQYTWISKDKPQRSLVHTDKQVYAQKHI